MVVLLPTEVQCGVRVWEVHILGWDLDIGVLQNLNEGHAVGMHEKFDLPLVPILFISIEFSGLDISILSDDVRCLMVNFV